MPRHRTIAGVAGVLLLAGIAIGRTASGITPAGRDLAFPATAALRPTPAAPAPFAGRLLVYGNRPLTPAQVRAVRATTGAKVAAVALHEEDVASGKSSYPVVPVLTMVTAPADYAVAVGRPQLAAALARGAVLAAGEARLRRLTVGGTLRFTDGRRVPVTAVVDDRLLGGNEMSLPAGLSRRGGTAADYLLVDDRGDRAATERAIRRALGTAKVRITTRTANGFLSSADRVLTQLQVKQRYGEFAMRRTGATTFVQDPAWVDRYLVDTRITQLGRVTCNRVMVPTLRAAMTEITRRDLGATVHTADFQYEGGCWNPNVIPGDAGTISRHSWGIAVDVNVDTNSFGDPPRQDPRLVAVMDSHDFSWGGRWLTPDGMHFEAGPTAADGSR